MYRTGPYVVDPVSCEIRGEGPPLALEPNVMRVLVCFLDRPGEIVSKETLLRDVWEGRFVSDDVVAVAVYQIRKAFSDRASEPRFLETVHRRGYRWRAPVARPKEGSSAWGRAFGWTATAVALGVFLTVLVPGSSPPALEARSAYERGRYFLDRRSPDALRLAMESFEEAARLEPHQAVAWYLAARGRMDDAIAHGRRASLLAPTRGSPHLDQAFILDLAGRHDEAVDEIDAALQLDASSPAAHAALGWTHALAGREEEALSAFRRYLTLAGASHLPETERVDDYFRYALATHGGRMTWAARARLHAVLGETEDALDCLERAYRERDTGVLWVASDPAFSLLRGDERFRSLLRDLL